METELLRVAGCGKACHTAELRSCNFDAAASANLTGAAAGGRPHGLGAIEPAGQLGPPPAFPSTPDSRVGRSRSPVVQGRDRMDAVVVGIDVSKGSLDVHVLPGGEGFAVPRDAAGLDELADRLAARSQAEIGRRSGRE